MRRSLSGIALLVILVFAAACSDGPTAPDTPVAQTVVLAPGQSATITGTSLSLRFVGVEGDSRCPADAFCVLGGSAQVLIDTIEAGRAVRHVLHTGDMRPVTYGAFTIALVQLAPYPFSATPIDPADYRATLRVSR